MMFGKNLKTEGRKITFSEKGKLPGLFFTASLAFFVLIFGMAPAGAEAAAAGYSAEKSAQSFGSMALAPGKAITFEVSFKNTGTVAWDNDSPRYISLYADGTGKLFRHKYWFTAEQPGKMIEKKVIPGETAHFRFALQAPELSGLQTIRLKLAAENLTWIPGGILDVPVNITSDPTAQIPAASPAGTVNAAAADFQALKVIQSAQAIGLPAGGKADFTVGFKNVGDAAWTAGGENAVKICLGADQPTESFRDPRWLSSDCPAVVSSDTPVGQIGYFSFPLAGNLGGNFKLNFVLTVGGQAITGGGIILPLIISGTLETPVIPPEMLVEPEEPAIRIGLYNTITAETIRANAAFEVRDAENNLIFTVSAGATVTADFNFSAKTYSVSLNGEKKSNLSYLRFIAQSPNTIFEITSYENLLRWNNAVNNNKFRGNLELRWSGDRGKLYMINELPLESYVKGVAEVSNNTPADYLKTMAIAVRTYAKYNIEAGGKHPAGNFHLNASSYDQVYRGYNSELTLPNFAKAAEDTRGIMVTYNGAVVMTPYFSQSDGRTRSSVEAWGGAAKPWLVRKSDPNCAGMKLFGHGVGVSARGAYEMAKDGSNYEQILKYYYTGVELKKIY